jgi:hypothetical protein
MVGKRNSYSAELLAKHDNPTGQSCSPVSGDREEFEELREEVLPLVGLALELNTNIGVVTVTSCLDVGISQALEGVESLGNLVVLDVPSRHVLALIPLTA